MLPLRENFYTGFIHFGSSRVLCPHAWLLLVLSASAQMPLDEIALVSTMLEKNGVCCTYINNAKENEESKR